MRLSRRNARAIRIGIDLARDCIEWETRVPGMSWEHYDRVNKNIFRAYIRTMEPYNQLNDLRRVVNGN